MPSRTQPDPPRDSRSPRLFRQTTSTSLLEEQSSAGPPLSYFHQGCANGRHQHPAKNAWLTGGQARPLQGDSSLRAPRPTRRDVALTCTQMRH
ncbi:hypothetical protein NDU88_007072 [Pleurodeles waltl]|uniref:Uncharacterized protein n=1 Tax=Pleurodeles waltl TaxID=8319 RepID=A0AAV7VNN2_PLEWA|nr:hypothetical protein NDU88_007072 [Pleurodeles waltl]